MGAVHRVWAEDSGHRLCSFPGLESSAKEGKQQQMPKWPGLLRSPQLDPFQVSPPGLCPALPRDDTVMMVSLSHLC